MQLPTGSHVAVADGTQFQLFLNSGTEQEPSLKAVDLPTVVEAAHSAGQGDTPRQNRLVFIGRHLDREALNAVRKWRFEPVGSPVTTRRTMQFKPSE